MEQSDALLLRSVDYRERDRIVTLLTETHGRIGVLARGARGSRRRFGGGALEPFTVLRVRFRWGRGELGQLEESTVARPFPRLLGSLAKMTLAGVALDLVREVAPSRHVEPGLYETVLRLLEHLEQAERVEESLLLCFQLRVVGLVGLAPRLDACGRTGRRPGPGTAAYFDPREGTIIANAAGGGPLLLSGASRMAMLQALGPDWTMAAQGWSVRQSAEVRAAVHAFLEHRLEHAPRAWQLA